jgi:hypothetical protein
LLGRGPDPGEIEDAVAAGFAHAFGRDLYRDSPRSAELQLATRYHEDEFGSEN